MWKLTCFELSPLPICSFAGNKAVGSDKLNRSPDTIGTDRGGGGGGRKNKHQTPVIFIQWKEHNTSTQELALSYYFPRMEKKLSYLLVRQYQ